MKKLLMLSLLISGAAYAMDHQAMSNEEAEWKMRQAELALRYMSVADDEGDELYYCSPCDKTSDSYTCRSCRSLLDDSNKKAEEAAKCFIARNAVALLNHKWKK